MKAAELVQKAYAEAKAARARAYAPYSQFQVGAALVDARGRVFAGCNVENASYGAAVCAERVAILKAKSEGADGFADVVVVTDAADPATPCALCLQMMAEFLKPGARVWFANLDGIQGSRLFSELLPFPFGPRQLAEASAGGSKG